MNVNETHTLLRLALEAGLKMHDRVVVSLERQESGKGTEVSVETWDATTTMDHGPVGRALLAAVPYAGTSAYPGSGQYLLRLDTDTVPTPQVVNRAACELAIELGDRLLGEDSEWTIGTHASGQSSGVAVTRVVRGSALSDYPEIDDDEFVEHAARAIFMCEWADMCDDSETEAGQDVNMSGCDIDDIAPETDPACVRGARSFLSSLLKRYGADDAQALLTLCNDACRRADAAWPGLDPERWAHCMAMSAQGHGVHWTDDAPVLHGDAPIDTQHELEGGSGWWDFDRLYDEAGEPLIADR